MMLITLQLRLFTWMFYIQVVNIIQYYREGHLQRFEIAITCDFWTTADISLLIIQDYQ
jgi:hypothetical protein